MVEPFELEQAGFEVLFKTGERDGGHGWPIYWEMRQFATRIATHGQNSHRKTLVFWDYVGICDLIIVQFHPTVPNLIILEAPGRAMPAIAKD